jgi:hypothetical protein
VEYLRKYAEAVQEKAGELEAQAATERLRVELAQGDSDFPAELRDILLPILHIKPETHERVDYFIEESYAFCFGTVDFTGSYIGDRSDLGNFQLSTDAGSFNDGDILAILLETADTLGVRAYGPLALLQAIKAVFLALGLPSWMGLWDEAQHACDGHASVPDFADTKPALDE